MAMAPAEVPPGCRLLREGAEVGQALDRVLACLEGALGRSPPPNLAPLGPTDAWRTGKAVLVVERDGDSGPALFGFCSSKCTPRVPLILLLSTVGGDAEGQWDVRRDGAVRLVLRSWAGLVVAAIALPVRAC